MTFHEILCQLMMSLPTADGRITPAIREIIQSGRGHNRQILLAYPPKVGGTFMRAALIRLLENHYAASLVRGSYANTDQSRDLYLPSLLQLHMSRQAQPIAAVMHLHMYPSRHVTELIEVFGIPVVIGTRPILDCLKSSVDMTEGMEAVGADIDDTIISNGKPYVEMTVEERRHSVVHNVSLWYARFYAQWLRYDRECRAQGKPAPLWVRYDELKEEPVALLMRIARHVDPDHHYNEAEANAALARSLEQKAELRFNKGVAGRGQAHFTAEEQRVIYDILAKAGEEDLLRLGVLRPAMAEAV